MRPRLLDLFCGAGGCSVGYRRAGFDVVGVDHRPMPRYPFEFVQGDALELLRCLLRGGYFHVNDSGPCIYLSDLAVIHASPPCQRYSRLPQGKRSLVPRLVGTVRDLLVKIGIPWAIENVVGSSLRFATMLCGQMFGLKTYRHRLFESSHLLMAPAHKKHLEKCPPAGRRRIAEGGMISVCGHISQMRYARKVMGIDWMTRDELSQAIPPAYTEFIGKQLLAAIS